MLNSHAKSAFETLDRMAHFGSAVGICFINGHPKYSSFSYPAKFLQEYTDQEMAYKDATMHYGFQTNGVITWDDLLDQGGDPASFELARRYGIETGICFALEVEGRKTIASVSRRKGFPLSSQEIETCLDALRLATLSVAQENEQDTYSKLTIEYLELAAAGYKEPEMAPRLGLTLRGTRARRALALKEVGAKTVAEALVIAIRNGAINLY